MRRAAERCHRGAGQGAGGAAPCCARPAALLSSSSAPAQQGALRFSRCGPAPGPPSAPGSGGRGCRAGRPGWPARGHPARVPAHGTCGTGRRGKEGGNGGEQVLAARQEREQTGFSVWSLVFGGRVTEQHTVSNHSQGRLQRGACAAVGCSLVDATTQGDELQCALQGALLLEATLDQLQQAVANHLILRAGRQAGSEMQESVCG